jgi:hypothetical protein
MIYLGDHANHGDPYGHRNYNVLTKFCKGCVEW